MKKGIMILILCMLQICPVMANEADEQGSTYVPGEEEVGGTIYGSLSGKPLGEEPNPNPKPNPLPNPNPNPNPDLGLKEEDKKTDIAGSNTGDSTKFFLWIILFTGAYCTIRVYQRRREES